MLVSQICGNKTQGKMFLKRPQAREREEEILLGQCPENKEKMEEELLPLAGPESCSQR